MAAIQLDPHPTTAGHAAIYQALLAAESGQPPVTYYNVSSGGFTGGSVTASPISAAPGTTINLTVNPDSGMQLIGGTLKYNDGASDHTISGASFTMPAANVTVTAQFEPATSGGSTPEITTGSLSPGTVGIAYSAKLTASGGTPPYTWSATGLPAGLSINTVTGKVYGSPTTQGTSSVVATVYDSNSQSCVKNFSLTINPGNSEGTKLAKPGIPVLAGKTATWDPVASENNGCSLQLYKDGVTAGDAVMVSHGAPLSYNFSEAMSAAGSYTVTVTALGTGKYSDSDPSDQSDPEVVAGLGGNVGVVQLPATGIALGDNSSIDLGAGVQPAAGGLLTLGGQPLSLASYNGGGLSNFNLGAPQEVGDQSVLVGEGVRLESGTPGQPITLTNTGLAGFSAAFPDGTNMFAPSGWDETFRFRAVPGSGRAPAGFSLGGTVIEAGAPGVLLLFDRPVILTLRGVTGPVGFLPSGSNNWLRITRRAEGTYDNPTAPPFPGEAYISNGKDTKIITWHLTSFAGLVAQSNHSGGSSGGGGGGGGGSTPALSITTTALSSATAGQEYSETIGTNNAGTAPYTFTVIGGALPDGLNLTADSGTISGTPTKAGDYTFTITVKDTNGNTVSQTYELTVKENTTAAVPAARPAVTLTDIAGHWAQANIEKLVSMGAITGYPDGTFKPDNTITRAEFATVLVKAFKLAPKKGKVFADTAGHWARDSISTASAYGIVNGYDDSHFGPDDPITREQMAVMVVKAAKLSPANGELTFSDSGDISDWAYDSVVTAVKDGIIKGYPDNTFRPVGNATRAEAVTVIVNALK